MPERPDDKNSRLTLVQQPQEYFRELITHSLARLKLRPQPETEFYLVNLLNQFMTTEQLFTQDRAGTFVDEPLSFLLNEASQEKEPESQRLMFQKVGDLSLYLSGFFSEFLERRHIDVNYYRDLGEVAYRSAAERVNPPVRDVFDELSGRFASFVRVLSTVSEVTTSIPRSENEIIRHYQNWKTTGSERSARVLERVGIRTKRSTRS